MELVRHNDASGALLWRLSVADVIEPGPFSPLPGVDRIITLIEGNGFDLEFGNAKSPVALRSFEPVSFSGDWPTVATTVHGPSRDFNVMTARGKMTAGVEVARSGCVDASLAYIYALNGSATVFAGDKTVRAESGELIECRQESDLRVEVSEPGHSLTVRLAANDGAPNL